LAGDVLVVGAIDHVELWNLATYAEKVNAAEEIFKQGSD
jgi:DNA-binding transcriptional regulator/RsmH inhibitor MraZ